ncbi:hypothetical protein BP6252_11211 [Coleophoma cylindrospora]|uniref:Zn(2)-C6 fungal-type domain-containing protein n=1 Tax=Coleophoma cylindrospora TaxID=1849047 RepID=A0A3D8QPB0_9HELO|nr:hypothetical protein BP6252_11211 [Coleophoma cylindrospora]
MLIANAGQTTNPMARIRHVKCDETKPACLKCSGTGRKCDGYAYPPAKQAQTTPTSFVAVSIPPGNPYLDFSGSKLEHRFLTFFYRHTAPSISDCFDFDFWTTMLPLIGQSEPTIQHAMIAVAAVHARLESADELLDGPDKLQESKRLELRQYNKAIHHLQTRISDNGITAEGTLICCALLICLELLLRNIEQAALHLQGGLNILHAQNATFEQSLSKSTDSSLITRKLRAVFNRLETQRILWGQVPDAFQKNETDFLLPVISGSFSTIDEAAASLDRLLSHVLRFLYVSNRVMYTSSRSTEETTNQFLKTCTELRYLLDVWSDRFERFMSRTKFQKDARFLKSATLLRIFRLTGSVWLSGSISFQATVYDSKSLEFASIVVLASSLANGPMSSVPSNPRPPSKKPFSFAFEMGVIAPLYFTIVTCRDRKVRWKALSLLSTCTPRREGFWDADILEYVARRVLAIEEAGLEAFVRSSANAHEARQTYLPPEHDRVFDVTILHGQSWEHERGKGTSVTYVMKPIDGSDNWRLRREDIVVGLDSRYKPSGEWRFHERAESATARSIVAFAMR